jgi:hypothetical protein
MSTKGSFKKSLVLLGAPLLLADLILLTLGGSALYSYFRRGKNEKGPDDQPATSPPSSSPEPAPPLSTASPSQRSNLSPSLVELKSTSSDSFDPPHRKTNLSDRPVLLTNIYLTNPLPYSVSATQEISPQLKLKEDQLSVKDTLPDKNTQNSPKSISFYDRLLSTLGFKNAPGELQTIKQSHDISLPSLMLAYIALNSDNNSIYNK